MLVLIISLLNHPLHHTIFIGQDTNSFVEICRSILVSHQLHPLEECTVYIGFELRLDLNILEMGSSNKNIVTQTIFFVIL